MTIREGSSIDWLLNHEPSLQAQLLHQSGYMRVLLLTLQLFTCSSPAPTYKIETIRYLNSFTATYSKPDGSKPPICSRVACGLVLSLVLFEVVLYFMFYLLPPLHTNHTFSSTILPSISLLPISIDFLMSIFLIPIYSFHSHKTPLVSIFCLTSTILLLSLHHIAYFYHFPFSFSFIPPPPFLQLSLLFFPLPRPFLRHSLSAPSRRV